MSALLIPARREHIAPIAEGMRRADVDEIWAAAHATPIEALTLGFEQSTQLVTAVVDGELLCMAGVTPAALLGDIGVPWMLGTDAIRRKRRGFLPLCRPWVEEAHRQWSVLVNYVDARNQAAQRWLEWLGFTLFEPAPYGAEGLPFRRFEMVR